MNDREVDDRFNAAQMIAREVGALALQYFSRSVGLEVRIKGPQDIVSNADHDVEKLIRNRIEGLFPGDGFLGEESGSTAVDSDLPGLWVVDPIDGSACFVNSIPVWCVSIAFVVGCEIEIGVIYDPNANEMFASRRGSGAHLNGEQIRAGGQTRFDEGTVGIGYSTRTEPKPAVQAIERLLAAGACTNATARAHSCSPMSPPVAYSAITKRTSMLGIASPELCLYARPAAGRTTSSQAMGLPTAMPSPRRRPGSPTPCGN